MVLGFEATVNSTRVLKVIVEAVKDLVKETNWHFSPEGISMQSMDSSHVSLVYFVLKAESSLFKDENGDSTYRCFDSRTIGIKLDTLSKILSIARAEDSATLQYEASPQGPDVLNLIFSNATNERTQRCSMKLMEIEDPQLVVPDSDYDAIVSLPSALWDKELKALAKIGDTLSVRIENATRFVIGVSGFDADASIAFDLSKGDSERVALHFNGPVAESYTLKYLILFSKASSFSPTVTLAISKNIPLSVEYSDRGYGTIRFYLAPKIEDLENDANMQRNLKNEGVDAMN